MSFRQVAAVPSFAPLFALGDAPKAHEEGWHTYQADVEPILEKIITDATWPRAGGYEKNGCMMGACRRLAGDIGLGPRRHQASPAPAGGGLPAKLNRPSRYIAAGAPYSEQNVGTIKPRIDPGARD